MIKQLIETHASELHVPEDLDAEAILWAVYYCERYTKENRAPRFETAYAPGGYYYTISPMVRREFDVWGAWAACSYSNFQILYIIATELGYVGPPLGLDRDAIAIPYVIRLLNKRILDKGAKTPEEVADAYNSGSFRDDIKPWTYTRKFKKMYLRALRKIQCTEPTNSETDSTTEQ